MLFDVGKNVESKFRRDQNAVGVFRALFGLELIRPMRSADGNGERITARFLDKINNVGRLRVHRFRRDNVVFDPCEHAEFAFDRNIVFVRIFNHFFGERDVVGIRMRRAVDHDGRETRLDARHAQLVGVAVVEVQRDGNGAAYFLGHFDRAFAHVTKHRLVGVLARAA